MSDGTPLDIISGRLTPDAFAERDEDLGFQLRRDGEVIRIEQSNMARYEVILKHKFGALYRVTLMRGGSAGESYSHGGHETWYVAEGTIIVEIDGREVELLAGDSIAFKSSKKHTVRNDGEDRAVIIINTLTSTFG